MLFTTRIRHAACFGVAALTLAVGVVCPLAPRGVVLAQSASNPSCADPGPPDYPVAGGWFFTQEGRGCIRGVGPSRRRGYLVQDDLQGAFWTEFRRYGGLDVLGYPVSQRFNYPVTNTSGYVYQAFERGILQWHADTGQAELANVFEQFTQQGLDPELEVLGIPRPDQTPSSASFAADAERRMAWLSEPRFLARYFFDPIAPHSSEPLLPGQAALTTQEQAWAYFGLPQGLPEQPFLISASGGNRVSLYPLVHTFVAQRFQKGGMQLFLQGSPVEKFNPDGWAGDPTYLLDPTVVPGDGVQGCVALTAVGLLARTLGADKVVPTAAIQALPLDPSPAAFVQSFVPAVTPGQLMLQFQLSGSAFAVGEAITIHLTDARPTPTGPALPSVTAHVASTNRDGSWDQVLTARVGTFEMLVTGDTSGKTFDGILDLTTPTIAVAATGTANCKNVGLPVASAAPPAGPSTAPERTRALATGRPGRSSSRPRSWWT
ncbi:MAG: hypothetical protein ACR2IK_11920 [Chloroflexota bacterium]